MTEIVKKSDKITIALDCMGGDNAPLSVINGAAIAAKENKKIHFLFYGDEQIIWPLIEKKSSLINRYDIFHTSEIITSDDKPSIALRRGRNSSMRLAIDAVKNNKAQAIVSAGNTGALMLISKIVLRVLPGIDRPAIISRVPNQQGKTTILLDMGANVECDSDVLYQFACMGSAFAKVVLKIKKPSIGLLNVGSEDLKGKDSVRSAAEIIKESELAEDFYGFVEGDDITKGTVDVVVTDGFTGNITLKAIEGTAKMISQMLKNAFTSSILTKIAYILSAKSFANMKKKVDPRLHNGAMFVGLNGIVVKSHGNADKVSFANAIRVAISLAEDKINDKISNEVKTSDFNGDYV